MKKKKFYYNFSRRVLIFSVISVVLVFTAATFASGPVKNAQQHISGEVFGKVQVFADAITLISTEYVKPVDVNDLMHGAIRGMVNTLDGYSQFLDEEGFQDIREGTKGEFGGIGIKIGIRDGVLTVITPMEGTPAFEAGIEAGDKVIRIDGEITRDLTLDEAVRRLRGRPGDKVSVTVLRDDGEMLEVTMERAVIRLESVKGSRVISKNIGYIKLAEFQERTPRDIDRSLRDLKDEGIKGLVLDLRNNPGGLLDSAIEVADKFLKQGTLIVYTEGREPEHRIDFFSRRPALYHDIHIVVLINKGSASGAEILAGALQDNKRALLLGDSTFGKGSVQTVIPLRDNSALRLTTAAYYTPSGRNLMDKGIEPDIHVKLPLRALISEGQRDEDKQKDTIFDELEESENGKIERERSVNEAVKDPGLEDEQIRTAVNILKGVILFDRTGAITPETVISDENDVL